MVEWGLNRLHGIKQKIIIIAILQLIFFCVMGVISFRVFTAVYEKELYNESANSLNISSTVLDEELRKIEQMSFQISTDPVIQSYMEGINYEYFGYDVYRTRRFLIERLNTYYSQERYISSIQMMDTFGEYYVVGNQPLSETIDVNWINDMKEASGTNVWKALPDEGVLVSMREVRRVNDLSLSYLGSIIITINMEEFISGTLNLSDDKSFVIMKDDELMFAKGFPKEAEVFLDDGTTNSYQIKEIEDREYFYTSQSSRHSELTYHNLLPFDTVTGQTSNLNRLMIGSFILFLIIILLISSKLAQTISKPLEELTKKMKQVEMGNFQPENGHVTSYSSDEIGQLHSNFDSMIQKINTLIIENYSKQLIIKETEYRALQAQINPHFLYNTLDSINWLAKINKQEDISNIAESLGNMMRTIISKKEPLIPLQEELNIVHHYMVIQNYRYRDRLIFIMDQSEDLQNYRIPKLTVQPIVENAIQHSVEEMLETCLIEVHLTVKEESVQIMISDNGTGMSQETIESIYAGSVKPKRSGIGLANIMERIQIMFGDPYGIEIQSELGKGTTVIITLPTVKE